MTGFAQLPMFILHTEVTSRTHACAHKHAYHHATYQVQKSLTGIFMASRSFYIIAGIITVDINLVSDVFVKM